MKKHCKNKWNRVSETTVVKYGGNCRGLKRIRFMNDLEAEFDKEVDVINIQFPPEFMREIDLYDERRKIG